MRIEKNRIDHILNNIQHKKILVIGDVMLDRYVWGDCNRISPEAPVPVVYVKGESVRLGGCANVAGNLKSLGAEPIILGFTGDDYNGRIFYDILDSKGISDDFIYRSTDRPTTIKTRIMAGNQQIVRVDRENISDIRDELYHEVLKKFQEAIEIADGVIISDYGKGVVTSDFIDIILKSCNRRDLFVSVDPKERHFSIYRNISLITPNTKETSYAVGYNVSDSASVVRAGTELVERLNAKNVMITRGAEGMSIFTKNGEHHHFPTVAQHVYDVTGAGDTVIATATATSVAGADIREAAILSNFAAGISVSELGTKSVTCEEIIEQMESINAG